MDTLAPLFQSGLTTACRAAHPSECTDRYMPDVQHQLCGLGCSLHVASVVQMIHMIMHHGGLLRRKVFDELMTLACYIAATIHDYEHGGVNNDFLIQTRDKLAITYNDISPLENHHLAAAARLMSDPRYRFTDVSMMVLS